MAPAPKTLAQAILYFADIDNCIDYLANRRWPKGVTCPTCGRADISYVPSRRLWQCRTRHPKAQFSVKTGTILEESLIGLDKWMTVMWMVANCKNGVSSWEIHRSLGVTQKSAWFMLHRIRLGMQTKSDKLGGPGGEVEADEAFIGGSMRNMHKKERLKRFGFQRGSVGKTVVMGLLDRDKKRVHTKVLPTASRELLQGEIHKQVQVGTNIYTDDAVAYRDMSPDFIHQFCNHVDGYVQGRVHTNGLENFWALLKRGLGGTYVCVEPFHLSRYVDEQAFRYNNRATKDNPMNDADRFSLLCSQIVGKRLTYAELTAKESKKPEATSF